MLSKAMRYLIPVVEDRVGVGRWGLAQERERSEKRERIIQVYRYVPLCLSFMLKYPICMYNWDK